MELWSLGVGFIAGAVVGIICSLGVKYLFDRLYVELNESA